MDAVYPLESLLHPFAAGGDVRIVTAGEFRLVAWNNGGGTTRDIDVLTSAPAGEVVARLSLAAIERDGPFSDFGGYDRTIVPVAGGGVRLDFGGADVDDLGTIAEPYRFDGGRPVVAHVRAGPVSAFNVMTRRNRVRHRVAIGPPTLPFRLASSVVLRYVFVLSGRITIGARSFASRDGEAADGDLVDGNVGPGDALRVAGPAAVECGALAARTIVITVDIETAG